jgi:hypothetical protein
MVNYASVKEAYDSLPKWDMESISTSEYMREQFINRFVGDDATPYVVDLYLEHIIALQAQDIDRLQHIRDALSKLHHFEHHILDAAEQNYRMEQQIRAVIVQHKTVLDGMDLNEALAYKPTRIEYDEAHSYVRRLNGLPINQYEVLLREITLALENAPDIIGRPDMTKTEILQSIRKDKGGWRASANEVLTYLAAKGTIMKIGSKYHHKNHRPRMVETDFTRKVFETLYAGSMSINGIVKAIGYDNTYGRKKVRKTLDFLAEEGLVENRGYRWTQSTS